MKQIAILLAEGFEEIEAITCIDVLRRAGISVITAALDREEVTGSHEIPVRADLDLDALRNRELEGIVLPGGMPGAVNLRDDWRVVQLVRELHERGDLVSAICAAPIVLEKAGVLTGIEATSYPDFREELKSCHYSEERVVVAGNVITARGAGVAMEFALELVEYLVGDETADELRSGMLAR